MADESEVLKDEPVDRESSFNTEVLQNIPVNISVEVGRTKIRIKDLLKLKQGSVLELERIAGEPLEF